MMIHDKAHTFHIPVMGIGYTIDSPLKVAHYGISSVISLVDDILMEKMRKFYCQQFKLPFTAITSRSKDHRARRITAYLDLISTVATSRFTALLNSISKDGMQVKKYMDMLPASSDLKQGFYRMLNEGKHKKDVLEWVRKHLSMGDIDVNIMTKLDRETYHGHEQQPVEFNDAHAALRGFAKSKLRSSLVLSAGMNPKLYAYMEEFDDFYPRENGSLQKKITLKVSDYRSALIQGAYLAKKGLWVSEYRVESGLNCGGHAFATDGYLLGPILEEFKQKRSTLIRSTHDVLVQGLKAKKRYYPQAPMEVKISAQGGVGTAEEHQFMLEHYHLNSVGWGSPFLLVPEVVNVDPQTQQLLKSAREEDLLLSNTSPLGVLFNTLKGNTKDKEKAMRISKGKPGSPCPKKFASNNREFTSNSICTASRQYQRLKIAELEEKKLPPEEYREAYEQITSKSCICVGLGTSTLLLNGLDTTKEGDGVSICPGPNLAYFSETISLQKMVDHIYGRKNVLKRKDRPNMFIKEIRLYVDYFKNQLKSTKPLQDRQMKYLEKFHKNLMEGIHYYKDLFSTVALKPAGIKADLLYDLQALEQELDNLFLVKV